MATIEKESEMSALEAFNNLEPRMKSMLELSINNFAQKLWGKGLIDDAVHRRIFDTGDGDGSTLRSYYFMQLIYEKVKETSNAGEAKKIIGDVADIIGEDDALHYTAEILRKCDANSIREKIENIAIAIQGSLNGIATSAYAKNIIAEQEFHETTDSTAKHSKLCTDAVFNAVRATITNDPTKIEKFKAVLDDMGKPISDFVSKLERLMGPDQPDHC